MLPLLPLISTAFMAGIAVARVLPLALRHLAAPALVFTLLLFVFRNKKGFAAIMLAALFLTLGSAALLVAERKIHAPLAPYLEQRVTLTGYIHDVEEAAADTAAFLFMAEEIALPGGEMRRTKALVRVRVWQPPSSFQPVYGQRLQVTGTLLTPPRSKNDGGFDYASYLEASGAGAMLSVTGRDLLFLPGRGGLPWLQVAQDGRLMVTQSLFCHLPPEAAGLAAAMLLGERKLLPVETVQAYRTLGIAHLLVVSGLHVGFVAALALFFARRLPRKSAGLVLAALFILSYILLTGGRPPVWRAALMLGMALVATEAGRERDGLQALSAAAMLLLYFRPHWLFSPSFQFSFLATLGILILAPRLRPFFVRLPSFLAVPLSVTLAAQLGVLPLQIVYYSFLPLLAVPANLLCVPLVGLFMSLGLTGMAAGFIYAPLAVPFYLAALPVLTVLEYIPGLLASLPLAAVRMPPLHPLTWVLYLALLAMIAPGVKVPRKKLVTGLLVLNLLCWGSMPPVAGSGLLEVTFLDVGQGLSVFIRTPEGRTVLVDAGGRPGSAFDTGERIVLPFLRQRRVRTLDLMILTHPHEDHYGGMHAVVRSMSVRQYADNGEREDSLSFTALMEELQTRAVPVATLGAGDRVVLDGRTEIEVISPPKWKFRGTKDDANNNSLVLRLICGHFSVLITGDAEQEALAWLLGEQPNELRAVVLQVPHHGSRYAISLPFLDAVSARAAVIPVGQNSFGHPHRETLDLLAESGTTVFRTDLHGAVSFSSDGLHWHISTKLLPNAQNL